MELEGSLPCSQQSATGSYPEPDQSSPYYPSLSKIHFNTRISSHIHLGLPSGGIPSASPTKILYAFLSNHMRAKCPAHLILLDLFILIIPGEECKV
jgi:hypothetical protein